MPLPGSLQTAADIPSSSEQVSPLLSTLLSNCSEICELGMPQCEEHSMGLGLDGFSAEVVDGPKDGIRGHSRLGNPIPGHEKEATGLDHKNKIRIN